MTTMKRKPSSSEKIPTAKPGTTLFKLRERKIFETTAAFIGGGWLLLEFVERMLVIHYELPKQLIDLTFFSLLCALFSTLAWRWFHVKGRPASAFKIEYVVIPAMILATSVIDIRLLLRLGESDISAKWKNSIAILPFVNIGGDREQEYLCDGLTEELINSLSHVQELRVPARTSVFAYKDKAQDIRRIGKDLNVRYALESSARRIGDDIRITAQLIDAQSGYHLWSDKWDKNIKELPFIQDEMTLKIVDQLKVKLLGQEKVLMTKRHTENEKSHELYLQGLSLLNKRTESDIRKAIEFFEQATAQDPNYALAFAGIAQSQLALPDYSAIPPRNAIWKGKEAALKAVALDDSLAQAHLSLAIAYQLCDYDWKKAEEEFKKAAALNPGYAETHHQYGRFFMFRARHDKAITELSLAQKLDPASLVINRNFGCVYIYARKYDDALEQFKKTMNLDPDFNMTHFLAGIAYMEKGLFREAKEEYRKEKHFPSWLVESLICFCECRQGNREKLKVFLERNIQNLAIFSPFWVAGAYAELRDKDKTFEWLEKSYAARDGWLLYLKISPIIDPLRSDPRYKAMLKKIGLDD